MPEHISCNMGTCAFQYVCMPSALGLRYTCVSGKALVPVLQLLHKKQQNLDKIINGIYMHT